MKFLRFLHEGVNLIHGNFIAALIDDSLQLRGG